MATDAGTPSLGEGGASGSRATERRVRQRIAVELANTDVCTSGQHEFSQALVRPSATIETSQPPALSFTTIEISKPVAASDCEYKWLCRCSPDGSNCDYKSFGGCTHHLELLEDPHKIGLYGNHVASRSYRQRAAETTKDSNIGC